MNEEAEVLRSAACAYATAPEHLRERAGASLEMAALAWVASIPIDDRRLPAEQAEDWTLLFKWEEGSRRGDTVAIVFSMTQEQALQAAERRRHDLDRKYPGRRHWLARIWCGG